MGFLFHRPIQRRLPLLEGWCDNSISLISLLDGATGSFRRLHWLIFQFLSFLPAFGTLLLSAVSLFSCPTMDDGDCVSLLLVIKENPLE